MSTKHIIKVGLLASMVVLALAPLSALRAEASAQPETIDVVASGVGMNETEATKDALANAVRQAIGAIVGTDTLIENEEIVRDQILTYSDGFAKNYELVGKPSTTLSGLTSVTIRARIVRSKLIQKAKAANIAVVELDGKSMFAEAVSKIERNQSATALLLRELRDMPARLIKTEIVGEPVYNENTKTIQVALHTSVDRSAYDALVARIMPLLEGIGAKSFTAVSSDVSTNDDDDILGEYVKEIYFSHPIFPEEYRQNDRSDTQSSIMICVRANKNMQSTQWQIFMVDESLLDQINDVLRPASLSVDVMGDNQVTIDSHYQMIGRKDEGDRRMEGGPIAYDRQCQKRLLIYPGLSGSPRLFNYTRSVGMIDMGPLSKKTTIDFYMSPERLKEIKNIVAKVTPAGLFTGE